MDRRDALKLGVSGVAAMSFGVGFFRRALAAPVVAGDGPYGALGAPDAHGVRLPQGFRARLIGKTGELVAGTSYTWHGEPDGGATFATRDGGWIYVSNSELNGGNGGAGAVRFSSTGSIVDAYRILGGTKWNCAGGRTQNDTWLSCEEFRSGQVWECNPYAPSQGIARPALGRFAHEAAVVDPQTGFVYLTEDDYDSRFYRFRPTRKGDLSAGVLEAASVSLLGKVSWVPVSPERPYRGKDTTVFDRGEGAWFSAGVVYFTTTSNNRVWALDVATNQLDLIYDADALGEAAPLRDPDNITVHEPSGDLYVAEDDDDLQLVLLGDDRGQRVAAPFLQLVGHERSEVAGPAFSPDGTRLYVTSQRGRVIDKGAGLTFEITGPFRR